MEAVCVVEDHERAQQQRVVSVLDAKRLNDVERAVGRCRLRVDFARIRWHQRRGDTIDCEFDIARFGKELVA